MAKNAFKNVPSEPNENQFENLSNPINVHPSRTPLNTIPDPSQFRKELQEIDKDKSEITLAIRSCDRKIDSAHNTPARSVPKTGCIGPLGACTGPRAPQCIGERGGSSSRVSRGIAIVNSELPVEVQHFELVEDPSFWNDHNVQVLIRMRPLSNTEKLSQGYGRCLIQESLQTLVWLCLPEIRFTFDHIACETISQEKLFKVAGLPMVDNCMLGYNSCIFAYGQTGSGKTYTMMGEISQKDGKLNEDCGITPRLFEYLFTRIKEEEESRRDERLKYSCKCSFLEIYNEQITDLLEPSSTNLQLREDLKKGVYVENLTEYNVRNVDEVLKLLLQGAANRKVAGTNMNSESSRSHSVFTCIIESRWEKDSTTYLRFGRLNLVDLAGSERQKSSGAGERLKEAAYINKSLSTLGLVIMSLVDLAHGKHRHVPYRDSRLTFLLQDSLGGNSKTTIIANVSPSICSANETLSTLKFAQRAKLIQNNAKVNEDASGDVTALQHQIQLLKGQISLLMKNHKISRSLLHLVPSFQHSFGDFPERDDCDINFLNGQKRKTKSLEATIVGALRREKLAGTAVRTPEAQIEQRNHLALQRENEEDNAAKELEECKNMNSILIRKVDELQSELTKHINCNQTAICPEPLEFNGNDKISTVETMPHGIVEMAACNQLEDGVQQNNNDKEMDNALGLQSTYILKELMDARILLEAMEAEQVCLIEELEFVRQENHRLVKSLSNGNKVERQTMLNPDNHITENGDSEKNNLTLEFEDSTDNIIVDLQVKLDNMTTDLEEAQSLNKQHRKDHMLHLSQEHQIDLVREEVEMETTKTILHLQEEVGALQAEHQKSLCSMAEENRRLRNIIAAKDDEMWALHSEWERASLELTSFLLDGSKSLRDASGQIESIACSFPQYSVGVGEHVKRAAKICVEKEETIFLLEKSLEDAQNTILHMEQRLNSLRSATLALTEIQQLESDASTKEAIQLNTMLDDRTNMIGLRKNKLMREEDLTIGVEIPSQEACTFQMQENEPLMLHQILDELAKINNRLNIVTACTNTITNVHDSQVRVEDSEGWTTDFSTPGSSLSDDSIASGNRLHESPYHCCYGSPLKVAEETSTLEFEGGTYIPSGKSVMPGRAMINLSGSEMTLLCLRKEFKMAHNAFVKLDVQLAALFKEKEFGDHSQAEGVGFLESFENMKNNEQPISTDGLKQVVRPEMSFLQPFELNMQEDEAGCFKARKFVADEKLSRANSFFSKFEEAHATINEVNYTLNALTKANENMNILTGTWKQAGEELMVEKASLIEEIAQLKSDIHLRDDEHEILQDHSRHSLTELANSMSLLEGSFVHMQRDAEDLCKAMYCDALSIVQDILHFIFTSKSSLQDICAESVEKGFASFVVQQCHIGEYFNKFRSLSVDPDLRPCRVQEGILDHEETIFVKQNDYTINIVNCEEGNQVAAGARLEKGELGVAHDDPINEHWELKKELERKDILLKGLLFDFSLLQESASTRKDIKDEAEKLIAALSQVQKELKIKTSQLDDMLVQHRKLEGHLADTETAICASNSDLEQAKETVDALSYQNAELRVLLEDLYCKRSETEEQLEEQKETVKTLEKEIQYTASSAQKQMLSSLEGIKEDLRRVASERDELYEQVGSLKDRLDTAYSLADENEAIAVEARQESEASKIYAEQKEEEVKILEHSIEELEYTINVLEKKVYEMEHEVERHHIIRDSLELELQELNQRLSSVGNFRDNGDSHNTNFNEQSEEQLSRKLHNICLELHEAHKRIIYLEDERAEQAKEIKQCKEYISELVLHAEAQASQYQQKYKNLEEMVSAVKTDSSNFVSEAPVCDKTEKSSTRTRGSSSPFRCITSFVQQMNVEKDQELSLAKLHIEELDALASSRQKEVCMLNTRLAAAESMTHDVIRDLLGVKLDMTNYANLIDQCQLQKFVEEAHQQTQESVAMEQEIFNLRRQIDDLLEERERCILEVNRKEAEILAAQMSVEQLQERDQLLTAQNEMLKADKTNLQRRAAELDDMVKKLLGTQSTQPRSQQNMYNLSRPRNTDLTKRLAHSEKLLLRVNDELAQYRKSESSNLHNISDGRGTGTKFR